MQGGGNGRLPVIGIPARPDGKGGAFCPLDYVRAVEKAGGLPLLLPWPLQPGGGQHYLALLDGLLLSGGGDIDPVYWGEEPQPGSGEIEPVRDELELGLCRAALAAEMPVLGICRGHQVLAVAAGGALHQDLSVRDYPGLLKHSQQAPRWYPTHRVRVQPETRLASLFPAALRVNSFHHQAVSRVPEGFLVSARADDGVIEAIESRHHLFALGVQWHPEAMWQQPVNYDALFNAFVHAARTYGCQA